MYSSTLFLDLGSRRGEWSALRPGRILPGTHLQEAGWAPGPVWTGAEIPPPTGFDSRTVQSVAHSLYRLSLLTYSMEQSPS
jgi:hypothetical protein